MLLKSILRDWAYLQRNDVGIVIDIIYSKKIFLRNEFIESN